MPPNEETTQADLPGLLGKHGNVLAVDFAHRASGWVIVNKKGLIVDRGELKTKALPRQAAKDIGMYMRHELENYYILKNQIEELIHEYSCNHLVAEVTYFSQTSKQGILIGLGWALIHELGGDFITGKDVKNILCDDPTASKEQVYSAVHKLAGAEDPSKSIMFASDHIKDAFATYIAWRSERYQMTLHFYNERFKDR